MKHSLNVTTSLESEESYNADDASLRVALAESHLENTLLKAELLRTQQRLIAAEEALRKGEKLRDSDRFTPTLRAAPRSLRPSGTVCRATTATSIAPEDVHSVRPESGVRAVKS